MNKYTHLKNEHQKLINDFPSFYAFNCAQFKGGLKKLKTTKEHILSIGYGRFIKKTDEKKYIEMWKKINIELDEAQKDDEYLYQGFISELSNHEYCITYDYEDTLNCFNLKYDDLTKRELKLLEKAKEEYLKNCEVE